MTTSTSSSASASRSAAKNRVRSADDSALRDCGRFRVSVRTRSVVSISRTSFGGHGSACSTVSTATYRGGMCRNITELRGLEPPATAEEIEAAARQYVRKVSGITRPTAANAEAFEAAVAEVTATTTRLLAALPPRRQPPKTVPPLRRPEVQARLAGDE